MRILLLALLLAGCATEPVAPPVKILVPSYVSCVKNVPTRPEFEVESLPPDATKGAKVLALARDQLPWRDYEGQLLAVIAGCR